jgi:hypothetical protein
MDALHFILWLYLVPMGVVLLPSVLAFGKLGDMEGVTKEDIQIVAVLPLFNLYTAFCIVDVVVTSVIGYIKEGRC